MYGGFTTRNTQMRPVARKPILAKCKMRIRKKIFCLFLLENMLYVLIKTHPQYLLEESNFNFRFSRLWDIDIPGEKWINYLQTMETLIRCRILQCLICVCTVCLLPFKGVSRLQWVKSPLALIMVSLTFTVLWANSADKKSVVFFLFFSK